MSNHPSFPLDLCDSSIIRFNQDIFTTSPSKMEQQQQQQQQPQPNPLLNSPPELTPTEQDVLDEYERLAENMKKVHQQNHSPSSSPFPLYIMDIGWKYQQN